MKTDCIHHILKGGGDEFLSYCDLDNNCIEDKNACVGCVDYVKEQDNA